MVNDHGPLGLKFEMFPGWEMVVCSPRGWIIVSAKKPEFSMVVQTTSNPEISTWIEVRGSPK